MKTLTTVLLMSISAFSLAQTVTFSGVVVSQDSRLPIPSVNITVGNLGTASNTDGHFKLHLPAIDRFVSFSHIGFTSVLVAIDTIVSSRVYSIALTPSTTKLDEIIVRSKSFDAKKFVAQAVRLLPSVISNEDFLLESDYRQTHYWIIPKTSEKRYTQYIEAAVFLRHQKLQGGYRPIIKEVRRSNNLRTSSYNRITEEKLAKEERTLELSEGFLDIDYMQERKALKTDRVFWNPNPIMCRLNQDFVSTHNFRLDSVIFLDKKGVLVIKILPSRRSPKVETYLGGQHYEPDGFMLITEDEQFILEFQYGYKKILSEPARDVDGRLLQYVSQGDYFFKDIARYRVFNNKLYLSYLMRETKDNTYVGGLNESGLSNSDARGEDDFKYYKVRRELFVSRIQTQDDVSEADITPNYTTLFPVTYVYNKVFWDEYVSPLIDNTEVELLVDLGKGMSLESQFIANQNRSRK